MSEAIHVNGEARVLVGTGLAGALEALGVSVDGVDIEIRDHVEPIFTDTFGPKVPFDEQSFLQDALIRAQLIFYDEPVLAKLRPALANGVEGIQPEAGTLFGASNRYFRLLIVSLTDLLPWNFPRVRLEGSKRVKLGTRRNVWNLSFYASCHTGLATSSSGAVLYNRVAT